MLDGDDVLCCTATGDGKSAAFSVPILVLKEYNANPSIYPPGLPTRPNPVGIVVTPTKGLANNIVLELGRLNVTAFAYSRESLADARRQGISLADEVKACTKWQVICVDPEHLKTKDWRNISESPCFRSNLIYTTVDEVHLVNEWGTDFRVDFKLIGPFTRGRLPVSASVVGLSATLAPGKDTTAVCQSLGGRKTIIHFHTLDMLFRCYVYIWRLQSSSADKMRRTRMYHSLCPPEYNEETIRRIDEDPKCQVVLATIAFSNGINATSILDSISLGFSGMLDIMWQEKGRAGRAPGTLARGIVLVQQSTITLATKFLKCDIFLLLISHAT
ncbi:P-loop containing nucleoside triphosphate hydrolase protein [Mycena capillaripes]|nr:P-loop containing nucleoside triphosphate hydrolase protein [Mycena capillaripes]